MFLWSGILILTFVILLNKPLLYLFIKCIFIYINVKEIESLSYELDSTRKQLFSKQQAIKILQQQVLRSYSWHLYIMLKCIIFI